MYKIKNTNSVFSLIRLQMANHVQLDAFGVLSIAYGVKFKQRFLNLIFTNIQDSRFKNRQNILDRPVFCNSDKRHG